MSEFIKITGTRVILILNKNMDQKCLKLQCLSSLYTELSKQEVGSWAIHSLSSAQLNSKRNLNAQTLTFAASQSKDLDFLINTTKQISRFSLYWLFGHNLQKTINT